MDLDSVPKLLINLPYRDDRFKRSMLEIPKFFGVCDTIIVHGVKDTPVYRGIAQAHMNCIEIAKDRGWENVIIMEDDVRFQSRNSRDYADLAFNNLPVDWDILLSSLYVTKGLKKYNEYWSRTQEFCGLTFYVVNNRAYDRILEYQKLSHIDRAMTRMGLSCYVVNEFFAIQYEGYSDNTEKNESYSKLLNKFNVLK